MSRLLAAALGASLLLAAPAHAQGPALDDVALMAFDACTLVPMGVPIAKSAAGLGFSPSTQAPDRYVKTMGARSLQIRLTTAPRAEGGVVRTCSVGVWGRLDSNSRVTSVVTTRARAEGYTVPPAQPGPRGGTEVVMKKGLGASARGMQLSINDTIDPGKGAGVVLVFGWNE